MGGIKGLDWGLYKAIKDGFEQGYRERISILDDFFSGMYSLLRSLYERDLTLRKILNILYNSLGEGVNFWDS